MRTAWFSVRNAKEIVRDPLNLSFGLGFPLVLLLLLSAIQANLPDSAPTMFEVSTLTPGIAVFGLSFFTLFSALLISKDRGSAFLARLYTTPLRPAEFILGYTLPLLPIAMVQTAICYLAALPFGLRFSPSVLLVLVSTIPNSFLYIAIGLLCGSLLNEKQVGGVCGALLTNLSAWFSNIWFDPELVGGWFHALAKALPFLHAVELERAMQSANFTAALPHLCWVLGYGVVIFGLATFAFFKQMKQ